MKTTSSTPSSTLTEILFPNPEPRRSYDEVGYRPDPTFVGLLHGVMYTGSKKFACGKDAVRIHIFGRLSLPEGVSVLAETLQITESFGGNNNSRVAYLPTGTEVYYCPTGGSSPNLLWADRSTLAEKPAPRPPAVRRTYERGWPSL
jgi:hypothetical protein